MAQQNPPYWPAGWDRERFLNSDATGELDQLSGDQVTAIREGLIAEAGEPAFHEMLAEMGRRKAASGPPPAPAPAPEPPFMETMRLHEQRTHTRWDPWGFVVYKSPEIADEAAWEACKQRFARLVDESLAPYRGYPGLEEALARLQFQWIDHHGEEADASAASVARAALRDQKLTTGAISLWPTTPSPGLHHSLCLYVTPASLRSILAAPPANSAVPLDQRKGVPFVVAVSAQAAADSPEVPREDGDESNWRGFFNVAVEVLLTGLFPAVADDKLEPFEIGGHVRGEDVWWDYTRWGVYRQSN